MARPKLRQKKIPVRITLAPALRSLSMELAASKNESLCALIGRLLEQHLDAEELKDLRPRRAARLGPVAALPTTG